MQSQQEPILHINDKPIYLHEDWNHGIGGGLWSTGLAIAKYLSTEHGKEQLSRRSRVLELGSGNGFLGVCLMAANPQLATVVITDTKEHLPLIQKTLDLNSVDQKKFKVVEYLWGPTTPQTSTAITNYQYEDRLEAEKRSIYLLKPEYLNLLYNDLDEIMPYKKGSRQYVSENLKKGDNPRLYD